MKLRKLPESPKPYLLLAIMLALTACGGGGGADADSESLRQSTSVVLSGQFQKGPFIVGTEITIQELYSDLTPTGRSFQTETTSNLGYYQIPVTLANSLVEISANGYYFNEVSGVLSDSTIRLSALADISDGTAININILTHLAKKRTRTLVEAGNSFADAKQQAEAEVRSLFSFNESNTTLAAFDQMDISQVGGSNAFLLLASSIFQKAYETSAELSEYIESLSQDLSDNGSVNNSSLTDTLIATELIIELDVVRANLEEKYTSLGESVVLPNFESLINRRPVAVISVNQSVNVGATVTLDGSGSYDADGDTLTYAWVLIGYPDGSSVTINNNSNAVATFITDLPGTYQFELTVSDSSNTSDSILASVSTNNRAPVTIVGEHTDEDSADCENNGVCIIRIIRPGETLILDGSESYDPDNDQITYSWSNNASSETSDSAIWRIDDFTDSFAIPNNYKVWFTLTVTDEQGLQSRDRVEVRIYPSLTDNGNGTISDGLGHMWQKEDDGIVYIRDGKYNDEPFRKPISEACSNLELGGYTDWRLPNRTELLVLLDITFDSPTINIQYFQNTKPDNYVTYEIDGISSMWVVDFGYNGVREDSVYLMSSGYARCIRDL